MIQTLKQLAEERQEDHADYTIDRVRGYAFVDTCGHGYLAIASEDNGYSDALAIARRSNYSYLINGIALLEEDCDANEFLKLNLSN